MWETGSVQSVQTWNLCPSWSHSNLGPNNRPVCCFPRGLGICSADIGMVFSAGCQGQCLTSRRNTILPHTTRTHTLTPLSGCLSGFTPLAQSHVTCCEKDWCCPFFLLPPLYLLSNFDYAKIVESYEPHDLDQWLLTSFSSGHRLTLDMKWQSRIVCAKVNKNVKHWNLFIYLLMIIYYYQVNLNTLVFILWAGTDSLHFESSVLLGHIAKKKSSQPCKMTTWRVSSPKNENSVINYSPSCCSKPVRPSFIFGTQIKIFLMKYESFLTLHRQQGNYHIQGPER